MVDSSRLEAGDSTDDVDDDAGTDDAIGFDVYETGFVPDGYTMSDSPPPSVADLVIGGYHSCARLTDTTVRCWGAGFGTASTAIRACGVVPSGALP